MRFLGGKKLISLAFLSAAGLMLNQCNGYNLAYFNTQELDAVVLKVSDGDTLALLTNNEKLKVRLFGIDAPESKQSYGDQSRANLLALCPIRSLARVKIKDRDKYGRIVGIVFCNGMDVNAKQVQEGLAWAYKEYSLAYLHLEIQARFQSRGLWSESSPIKPSLYRKQNKSQAKEKE